MRRSLLVLFLVLGGSTLAMVAFAQDVFLADPPPLPSEKSVTQEVNELGVRITTDYQSGEPQVTISDEKQNQLTETERAAQLKSSYLLRKYRETSAGPDREKIVVQLRNTLQSQFQARQGLREAEIKRLEGEINRLRQVHARRNEQSKQIVEERLQQLLRDADGLGWGGDGRTGYDANGQWQPTSASADLAPTPMLEGGSGTASNYSPFATPSALLPSVPAPADSTPSLTPPSTTPALAAPSETTSESTILPPSGF